MLMKRTLMMMLLIMATMAGQMHNQIQLTMAILHEMLVVIAKVKGLCTKKREVVKLN